MNMGENERRLLIENEKLRDALTKIAAWTPDPYGDDLITPQDIAEIALRRPA